MPIAPVDGTTLYYEAGDGDRPPCLVLHGGLGLDHTLYRASMGRLADTFRPVFYDHRHNGRSGRPAIGTVTMERLADDAVALADHLGLDRFVALGHSYGGFVAQELALRHQDRLLALVLVATTPGQLGTGEEPGREQGPPAAPEFLELLTAAPATDEEMAVLVPRMLPFFVHRIPPEELAALTAGTVFDAAAQTRGMAVLAGWSSVDRLASVALPTLVVGGRHDVVTSWPQSQRIADRVPGPTLVVLADSGHFPWIEEPEAFFSALEAWAAALQPVPGSPP